MTNEHEASRTLVKSPPELWAECSDPGSLARHLGEFGEIRITRLEPESAVAWEGDHASGTVRIEPSGWGTRVTLTAQTKVERTAGEPPPGEAQGDAPAQCEPPAPAQCEPPTSVPSEPPTSVPSEPPTPVPLEARTLPETDGAEAVGTLEGSGPVSVDDTGRARSRWRRMTARMRGLFGPPRPEPAISGSQSLEEPRGYNQAEPVNKPEELEEPEEPKEPEELRESEDLKQPEEPQPGPRQEPEGTAVQSDLDAEAVLASALKSLGQAHHRPFSRA